MTQASLRPPPLAVWLVELFVSEEQASSVLGDLLEEFSGVATKSSISNARRWYWRQTLPTVLHLLGSGFRAAPWFMAAVVAGGIALVELGRLFTLWSVDKEFKYFNHYVFPYFYPGSPLKLSLGLLLANGGTCLYRFTVEMLIGCIVALLSKQREMPATLALSLVCSIPALTRFLLAGTLRYNLRFFILAYFFGGLFAFVAGGAIVKSLRLRSHPGVSF